MRPSARRIMKELSELYTKELEGVIFEPIDENDPYRIHGFIIGPPDTPYEGGQFKFCITLEYDYPFKPPKFIFKTKIFGFKLTI